MTAAATSPPVRAPTRARRVARRAGRAVVHVLAAVGAWSLLYHGLFEASTLTTGSMAPALLGDEGGRPDTILIETRLTAGAAPRRFQVVAFRDRDLGVLVAKRVVAFGGETLAVREGGLVVDGVAYPAPPGAGRGRGYVAAGNLARGRAFAVPAGHVYLLGDDSVDSDDSRFLGPLPVERIHGRVLARVWPLDRLGLL